jgi:Bacterial Ig-like domain (group 3).
MVVTATYNYGTTQTVTGYTTSGYNKSQKGNQIITVTYQGKTATFTINVIDPAKQTVATPTASPSGGMIASGTMVTLSTTTSGAEIWYTTNGSTPSKYGWGSTKYTSPFAVTPPRTVNAIAIKDGMNDSGILEAVYTVTPILRAEIEITAPTYGGTPAATISSYADNFNAGNVTWLPNDYSFLPNTEYTATVTLWANSGFSFIGLTETTVNGQTATVSDNTGGTVTLTYKFPATGARIVTGITISSQPYELNYTYGDTLDLSGLGVTLFYNTTDPATNSEYVSASNFSAKGITANPSAGDNLSHSIHNGKPITITYGSLSITTANLTVNAKNVSALTIEAIQAHTYTGSEILPVITVKDGAATLRLNEDYTTTYTNNTNAGTATVTINGTGNYTGSRTVNFFINRADPSVTWPTVAPITYGTALSDIDISGGASTTAGTFAWNYASWNYPEVGTHTYGLIFTPTDTNNYNTISNNNVSITVIPANLSGTITISPVGPVIINTQLTATYNGSEYVSYQWKKDGNNVGTNSINFTPTTKGSYTVTVSATNYNGKTSATVTVINSWIAVADSTFGTSSILAIAYGNGKFVAGGYNGKMAFSTDGISWTAITQSIFSNGVIRSIAYGNNKFVAVSDNIMAYSTDGVTWTAVTNNTFDSSEVIYAIAYGNGKFVAGTYSGKMATSPDGLTWTAVNSRFGNYCIFSIAYGNGMFVAVGAWGRMATSPDGITWTAVTNNTFDYSGSDNIRAIVYGNNMFIACVSERKMATSPDGITWTAVSNSTLGYSGIYAIAYGNGKFVAGGGNGKTITSTDGETWTELTQSAFTSFIYAVAYGNGKFVAVGGIGEIAYLLDD